jgi:uncharacterized protein YkwD
MNKTRALLVLGAAMMAAIGMVTWSLTTTDGARAAPGPCVTSQAHVSTPEEALFNGINGWRAGALGAPPMTLSGPVNEAAQIFAEAMIAGSTSGHLDSYGRTWVQRLIDCGYSPYWSNGSGEALAGFGSSNPSVGSTPGEALASMTNTTPGHQNGVQAPVAWACGGVGYATNPNPAPGQLRHAWVVVVAQYSSTACPEPGVGSGPPTSTSTATTTITTTIVPTNTPTKTPSPTPTATPTPVAEFGVTITVCGGWNLLTMPVTGEIDAVFDTALLDVAAIYLQNGETWLRWAPGVPAYARNLSHVSSGDVLWIYRPEPSCEDIEL